MSCLTPRQREAVALLATGRSNDEIAVAMRCSPDTVKKHLTHAALRAGLYGYNRVELAVWFVRHESVAA